MKTLSILFFLLSTVTVFSQQDTGIKGEPAFRPVTLPPGKITDTVKSTTPLSIPAKDTTQLVWFKSGDVIDIANRNLYLRATIDGQKLKLKQYDSLITNLDANIKDLKKIVANDSVVIIPALNEKIANNIKIEAAYQQQVASLRKEVNTLRGSNTTMTVLWCGIGLALGYLLFKK